MTDKKRGRPSLPDDQKRQQIGVRVSSELKADLEAVSAANGRSVAQEAELRLLQSFADGFDANTAALLRDIGREIMQVQQATKGRWYKSLKTWGAVAEALERGAFVRSKPDFTADDEALAEAWEAYVQADFNHSQIIAELAELGFAASKDAPVNALLAYAPPSYRRGAFGRGGAGLGGLLGMGIAADTEAQPSENSLWLPHRQREHEQLRTSPDYEENRERLLALHVGLAALDSARAEARDRWSALYQDYVKAEIEGRDWYRNFRRRVAYQQREAGQPYNVNDML